MQMMSLVLTFFNMYVIYRSYNIALASSFSTMLKFFKLNILKIFTADNLRDPQVNSS